MLFLTTEVAGTSRFDSLLRLIGTLILFLVVIVFCFFVTRFVGGRQLAQQKNSNFTVLDTMRLAQNRFLQIIQVGNRYFVIAISKDQISLIAELQKEDITYWREAATGKMSFQDIFSSVRKRKTDSTNSDLNNEAKVDIHEEQKE